MTNRYLVKVWVGFHDSIELIVLLGREYGIDIKDPKEGRKVLTDINTMVAYIEQHRTK
jgi:acyl carrier protein